jgi:hypothetical protein
MRLGGAIAVLPVRPGDEVARFASGEGCNGAERGRRPSKSARYRRLSRPERKAG